MSKTFGYLLLAGVLGSIIISIVLMMWVWIRASNATHNNTATPTRSAQLVEYNSGVQLVDARLQAVYRAAADQAVDRLSVEQAVHVGQSAPVITLTVATGS